MGLVEGVGLVANVSTLQGNIDRCNRVKGHVESTTRNMFMVSHGRERSADPAPPPVLGVGPKISSSGCSG